MYVSPLHAGKVSQESVLSATRVRHQSTIRGSRGRILWGSGASSFPFSSRVRRIVALFLLAHMKLIFPEASRPSVLALQSSMAERGGAVLGACMRVSRVRLQTHDDVPLFSLSSIPASTVVR